MALTKSVPDRVNVLVYWLIASVAAIWTVG